MRRGAPSAAGVAARLLERVTQQSEDGAFSAREVDGLLRKLGAESRGEAVATARRRGVIVEALG